MDATTAAQAVFSIPELMELIILALPAEDITLTAMLNQTCHSIVTTSPGIRKRLELTTSPCNGKRAEFTTSPDGRKRLEIKSINYLGEPDPDHFRSDKRNCFI